MAAVQNLGPKLVIKQTSGLSGCLEFFLGYLEKNSGFCNELFSTERNQTLCQNQGSRTGDCSGFGARNVCLTNNNQGSYMQLHA